MHEKITVVVFLEGTEEKAARRTIDSVFAQRTDFEMQVMVCDLMEVLKEGIYDYEAYNLTYIPVNGKIPRFELEMALREQIQCPYFTIIDDKEYWTDSDFLQKAVNFLDKEEDFSMYGANAYMESKKDAAYHLDNPQIILCNTDYMKNIVYGIEDYIYNLDMDGNTFAWLEPAMLVCKNNISNSELETILAQEELVQNVYTKRRGMSLLYLKKGMSLMDDTIVAHSRYGEDSLQWRQHMKQALEVYAFQYHFSDRLSPKRIWDRVYLEYIKGSRELKEWEQHGNSNLEEADQRLLEFLARKCKEQVEQSPLWIQNCGENHPDKLFMVLQISIRGMGVFSTLFNFLGAVDFAKKNGALVLVDLEHAFMAGLQKVEQRGKENSWEYYFKQPETGYTLDDVYRSKNVIKCDTYYWCNPRWYDMFPVQEDVLHKWAGLIKKYFQLTTELQERCECLYKDILKARKRVLGVCVRNNFALLDTIGAGLSHDHPRQPGLEAFIAEVYKCMKQWECPYIYLVADDAYVIQEFQKEFGACCLFMERQRSIGHKNGKPIEDVKKRVPEDWDIVENNKEYVCDTYLLSRCTSLLSGNCGCGRMAYYWNDGQYENVKVFEDGCY